MYSTEPIGSVHMFSQFHFSFDERVRAGKDGHVSSADVVEHVKSVLGRIGKVGVSGRGGNTQQVNFRGMASVDDGEGVIETRVTVQPHSNFLLGLHFWISF